MSSNLTCYHAEFVNSGQFLLPPLCKLPELPCKIPGVCTNSWRAPGRHRKAHGVEVRNYSSHHRGMFVLQTAVLVEESCLSPSPLWLLSPQLLTLTQAQGTRSMRCTDKEFPARFGWQKLCVVLLNCVCALTAPLRGTRIEAESFERNHEHPGRSLSVSP